MPVHAELAQQLQRERQQVDVDHFDLIVREVVRMAHERELDCAPEYQRRFRWSEDDESRLVESLFLGLPVPPLFVAANVDDGTWDLVDGLQRVSTVIHFVAEPASALEIIGKSEPLVLANLDKLTELNGQTYADLPKTQQLQFDKRFLRVTVLSDKSAPDVRYELFDRLNRGSVRLTPQEVRACVHRGPYAKMLRELAKDEGFNDLIKLQKAKLNDGTREEVVLKFFAYLHNRADFTGAVRDFLDAYMAEAASTANRAKEEALFRETVSALSEIIDGPVLRSRVHSTPVNQLEGILVGAGELVQAGETLVQPGPGWLDDAALVHFSTKGTNTPNMLEGRIRRARELLSGSPVVTNES